MNKHSLTAIAAAFALAFGASALAAQALSKDDYKAGKDKIAAEYKSAKAACSSLKANAKDVCIAEAAGKQKVAKAELEARNEPGDKSRRELNVAKAEADYSVAKEKCDDQKGAAKSACVKEAKATEARALAEAKNPMKTSEASKPAKVASATAATAHKAGDYADDTVITGKVKAAVLGEPSLKSAEINVETHNNVVQLTGFVSSQTSVDKAVQVARGVEGVTSVKNDMVVKGKQ